MINEFQRYRGRELFDERVSYYERMQFMTRTVMFMMVFMFIFITVFQLVKLIPTFQRILEAKADITQAQAEGFRLLPDLEARLIDLDKRTKALTTAEIDSRLSAIETAIQAGDVDPEQLLDLQQLREEFESLKSFMFANPEQLVDFRTLQRDYLELRNVAKTVMPRADIVREIDSTKSLLYWNLGVFGAIASIFAGAWFIGLRHSMRIRKEPADKTEERADKDADA